MTSIMELHNFLLRYNRGEELYGKHWPFHRIIVKSLVIIKISLFTEMCWLLHVVAQMVKNRPATRRPRFDSWVGKMFWRRAWQPSPVFLPGESHGQGSLAGYSLWGHRESNTTERLSLLPLPHVRYDSKGFLCINSLSPSDNTRKSVFPSCKERNGGSERLGRH